VIVVVLAQHAVSVKKLLGAAPLAIVVTIVALVLPQFAASAVMCCSATVMVALSVTGVVPSDFVQLPAAVIDAVEMLGADTGVLLLLFAAIFVSVQLPATVVSGVRAAAAYSWFRDQIIVRCCIVRFCVVLPSKCFVLPGALRPSVRRPVCFAAGSCVLTFSMSLQGRSYRQFPKSSARLRRIIDVVEVVRLVPLAVVPRLRVLLPVEKGLS